MSSDALSREDRKRVVAPRMRAACAIVGATFVASFVLCWAFRSEILGWLLEPMIELDRSLFLEQFVLFDSPASLPYLSLALAAAISCSAIPIAIIALRISAARSLTRPSTLTATRGVALLLAACAIHAVLLVSARDWLFHIAMADLMSGPAPRLYDWALAYIDSYVQLVVALALPVLAPLTALFFPQPWTAPSILKWLFPLFVLLPFCLSLLLGASAPVALLSTFSVQCALFLIAVFIARAVIARSARRV